jgi:U3 small nucleolar RNA-associated protein 16
MLLCYKLFPPNSDLTSYRFEAARKIKRREHDSRLKLQAKSAKTHAKTQRRSNAEYTTIGAQETEGKAKSSAKASLPILLPEEILAAEPVVRPPTPPSSINETAIKKKQKFLDAESRPPKDIKRGNVRIRVLQEERSILPPKASQTSKALRESWLAGRQGFKGNIVVPRRKLGGGFVRK